MKNILESYQLLRHCVILPDRHSTTKQQFAMLVFFPFTFRFGSLGALGRPADIPRLRSRSKFVACYTMEASKNTTDVKGKPRPMIFTEYKNNV